MTGVRSHFEPMNDIIIQGSFCLQEKKMAREIQYTTVQQQIDSLKEKGLTFDNEIIAKKALERYGYYNIVNSYKEPYQMNDNGVKKYIPGTTFEQIYSVFTLDHNLRNAIMASMLELEESLRAATAEVIAVSYGVNHNEYLSFRNYRDRYCANPKFTLNAILGKLHNNAGSDKDPIRYYRERYHVIPPWILLKGTYFSTLINLIKYFKKEQKQRLMRLALRLPEDTIISDELTTLFQSILYICLDYRNAAAHGGRIYNFSSKHTESIRITEDVIKVFPRLEQAEDVTGIQQLLILLTIFVDNQSFAIIQNALDRQVNRHLQCYPNDIEIISNSIGISIKSVTYVWINEKTKKFHANEACSGIISPIRKNVEDVDCEIYSPCKRCVKTDE